MVIKKFKTDAIKVKVERQGNQYICRILFDGEKTATMIFAPGIGFSMYAEDKNGDTYSKNMASPYFNNLIADILRFYKTSEVSFDTLETLKVIKLREAIIKAKSTLGEWINV